MDLSHVLSILTSGVADILCFTIHAENAFHESLGSLQDLDIGRRCYIGNHKACIKRMLGIQRMPSGVGHKDNWTPNTDWKLKNLIL